jgi:oxygen-independent coproporphyrinogen-3 oxidase
VTPLTIASPPALEPARLPAGADVEGLYVHVPFCFHKCHYCDFYSITRQDEGRMARFVELLLAEADLWRASPVGSHARPRTVFFGGGTPTLLPDPVMRRLLDGLRERFDLGRLEEWTVEVNPATARPSTAPCSARRGVDRLSFGAQSFNPRARDPRAPPRPDDVARSIELARTAGSAG